MLKLSTRGVVLVAVMALGLIISVGCEPSRQVKQSEPQPQKDATTKTQPAPKTAPQPAPMPKPIAQEHVAAEPTGDVGILAVDKDALEFGKIEPSQKMHGTFTLTNKGSGPAKIGTIKSSCGCTVPKLKKTLLQPGESTEVAVTYNAGSHPGRTVKRIWVNSEENTQPKQLELKIIADIINYVEHKPVQVDMKLWDGAQAPEPVVLTSTDETAFKITGFTSSSKAVTAEYDPEALAKEHSIVIKYESDELASTPRGNLTFQLDHPKVKRVSMPFMAQLPFEARPARLFFRTLRPGDEETRTVAVISNQGSDFKVTQVRSENEHFKIGPVSKSEDGFRFDVTASIPKDFDQRVVKDNIFVEIEGSQVKPIEVYCYGRVLLPNDNQRPGS